MRKLLFLPLTIVLFTSAFGQEKPITKDEYVKMLYSLERRPVELPAVIEALRHRGIDFVLTDGLRSVTRTKGRNDAELKRAIEEADRRRQNPGAAQLPSEAETSVLLESARKNTLEAVSEMPDFVVKQQIQRSAAYAGTNNFRNLDRLVVAVSYKSSGEEDYKVLSVNGALQNDPRPKQSYEEVGGTSSTGEFVTMLATIFKPESEARFRVVDTDLIRGRRAVVFDFEVDRDKAKQRITATGLLTDTTITGIKGRIWIDREDHRVLRIESEATEIPESFPIRSAKRNIDYDWTVISAEKYLLPTLSDVRLTHREKSTVYESRNVIRFKDYQKYGTDVIVLDEDNAPVTEEKPKD